MTMRSLTLLLTGLPLALGAGCCPSIWLTVVKDDPGVRLPLPKAQVGKIPMARHYANRFDVFTGGAPTIAYPNYRDSGGRTPISNWQEAILELGSLQEDCGNAPDLGILVDPSPHTLKGQFVDCVAGEPCATLRIDETLPVQKPLVVQVTMPKTFRTSATSCPRVEDSGASPPKQAAMVAAPSKSFVRVVQACESLNATQPTPAGCQRAIKGGTYMTLAAGIQDAKAGDSVELQFSEKEPRLAQTLLTFFHLADIQLRDPDIRLGDRDLSRQLDWLIQSFEYDADMERYGRYVLEAIIETMNEEVRSFGPIEPDWNPERPTLAIHAGDAIDSGAMSELRDVHRLLDRLETPFFNQIGNHDILTFGNLVPTSTRDSDQACATVDSLVNGSGGILGLLGDLSPNKICVDDRILCPHCLPGEATLVAAAVDPKHPERIPHSASRKRFVDEWRHAPSAVLPQLPTRAEIDDPWTCKANPRLRLHPPTIQHGFDLNNDPKAPNRVGYYTFAQTIDVGDQPSNPRQHVIFVVLDTDDLADPQGGTGGRIGKDQMEWLQATLTCAQPQDLVVVFAHHAISAVATENGSPSLADVLAFKQVGDTKQLRKNVVGYFYGHSHEHGICRDSGHRSTPACHDFWEVETASIIEFPQEARLVRLKYAGAGLAFFELTVFRENLTGGGSDSFAEAVRLGRRGAERDWCRTHEGAHCSEDLRVYREDGRHANARLFFRLPK